MKLSWKWLNKALNLSIGCVWTAVPPSSGNTIQSPLVKSASYEYTWGPGGLGPWIVLDNQCGFNLVVLSGRSCGKAISLCCPRGHDGWSPQGTTSAAAACPCLHRSSKTNRASLSLWFVFFTAWCDGGAGKSSTDGATLSPVQVGWSEYQTSVKLHLEPLFPLCVVMWCYKCYCSVHLFWCFHCAVVRNSRQ